MRQNYINHLLTLLLAITVNVGALATETIHLGAAEREPYIGRGLPNQGYVYEIVSLAFQRVGYEIKIDYYPLNRAKKLALNGDIHGLLPAYFDESLSDHFLFSLPFPGDNVGILKKKSFKPKYRIDPDHSLAAIFQYLSKEPLGIVRGADIESVIDKLESTEVLRVTKDIQILDILASDRVNFAVIDKYTAADLMVERRPHLIGEFDFLPLPSASNDFHIAFSKKYLNAEKKRDDFNRGLKSLFDDGAVKKILAKHGLLHQNKSHNGVTNLTIATVNNPDMITMRALSREFENEHPKIKLTWRLLDENVLRRRLLSDIAIGDGQFDIMTIGSLEAPIWGRNGWLAPIKNLPDSYDVNDILKPVQEALSVKRQLFALPFYAESSMTFYRKDVFQKFRLEMPSAPTYDDIKRFAATIHDPENNFYGICLRGQVGWGGNMTIIGTMVNTFGGRWFDENWNPTIDTPAWKNAINAYKDLVNLYGPPQSHENGFNENLVLFSDGHCGMWIDATVAAGKLFNPKISKVHDKVGFTAAPIAVTPKGSHWLWVWALGIPESSHHKEEALKFVAWATSKDYIRLVAEHEGWGAVPPGTRYSTYSNPRYHEAAPFSSFVLEAIQTADLSDSTLKHKPYLGIQLVIIPEYPSIGNQIGALISKAVKGEITVDKALKESQALTEKQMKRSGY